MQSVNQFLIITIVIYKQRASDLVLGRETRCVQGLFHLPLLLQGHLVGFPNGVGDPVEQENIGAPENQQSNHDHPLEGDVHVELHVKDCWKTEDGGGDYEGHNVRNELEYFLSRIAKACLFLKCHNFVMFLDYRVIIVSDLFVNFDEADGVICV